MANTIKVLFWLRRNKINSDGLVPLMLRISYQNIKAEKATGYYVNPKEWNTAKQRVRGDSQNSIQINSWMDNVAVKISDLFRIANLKKDVHLPSILQQVFSKPIDDPTLLATMQEHNDVMQERVGLDFSHSTYEKYVFTYNKLQSFISHQYNKKDFYLRDLSVKFIMEFDHFLRTVDKNQHNTAVKYCLNLKKIINLAILQGKLASNPLKNYKTIYKDTPQVYLEHYEVERIENADLKKQKHLLTRDLFLFQCFTGLAYTDLISLKTANISKDNQNRSWIIKPRQKSGIISTIPLLQPAENIIQRYSVMNDKTGVIFPHYSIQKYNQYISEIGEIIGLEKRLSSHVGRRTFGNLALSKGISLNVISKILGHSNTIITQRIYAITTQNIITGEIQKWR
jgi:integrase